ncbi:MAG: C1 family peptidase, partial [Bacteroidota bacterium]
RGLEFEDEVYNSLPLKPSYFNPQSNPLPASYSLKKYCPRVVTQHNSNTGVAWAAVWYARTMLEAIANGWNETIMITQNAFSPIYNYKQINKGADCSDKIKLTSILESLRKDGGILFNDFREFCYDTIPIFPKAKASLMPGYVRLFSSTDTKERKVDLMKRALLENGPVIIGMICPPSFSLAADFWQPRERPERDQGGHSLCVVGYDDSKFGGAFEVVNSWGKSWGMEGFTWFRYEDVENYILYGFELLNTQSMMKPAKLSAKIDFTINTGETMSAKIKNLGYYKLGNTFPTGTTFKTVITVNQNVFFYAIYFDQKWHDVELYPNETKGIYPWLEDERRKIKLPVGPIGDEYFKLDPPAGKNYFCLVLSGQYLDIEDIKLKLEKGKGEFVQRYYSGPLKDPSLLTWNENAIELEGAFNRSTLWIVIVEIDQT